MSASFRLICPMLYGTTSLTLTSHHLAPVSGSIDPNEEPLPAAWRELSEETSLDATSVSHWRTGKPFTFADASVGRQWTIYPFAFRLKDPSEGGQGEKGIRIDWEHEGWQWFDPDTVVDSEEFGGVPRLHESLRRVWFEGEMDERAGKTLVAGLNRLQTDHQSGSQELASVALVTLRDIVVQTRDGLDDSWWSSVRTTAWHLGNNGRESMGTSMMNAFVSVLGEIDEIRGQSQANQELKWDRILAAIDHHIDQRKSRTKKIKESFISYLRSDLLSSTNQQDEGKKNRIIILTLSASSTIRDSILDAYAALEDLGTLELRILESRPLFEGVNLASSLLSQFKSQFPQGTKNLEVKIYTDASAAHAATGVDLVLLGADRISSTKGVSNKTGSLPAVLSAKHIQPSVKVLVLSDLEKVEGLNQEVAKSAQEENDPMEVIAGWDREGAKGVGVLKDDLTASTNAGEPQAENAHVEVKNIYFEWVPLAMVDALVCEEGILGEDGIREKSRQIGENMERLFGDL